MSAVARQTVRAGRLRLIRFAGTKVFTYSSRPAGRTVVRAGVTTASKER